MNTELKEQIKKVADRVTEELHKLTSDFFERNDNINIFLTGFLLPGIEQKLCFEERVFLYEKRPIFTMKVNFKDYSLNNYFLLYEKVWGELFNKSYDEYVRKEYEKNLEIRQKQELEQFKQKFNI